MARFELTTTLAAPIDAVWQALQRPATLVYVSRGWLSFRPIDPPALPERWPETGGTYRVGLTVYGVLPFGQQTLGVEFPEIDPPRRAVRDNGHGSLIRVWDHWILLEPAGDATRYTDRLRVEAGALTLPVTLWAKGFYAHRQRRWRRLVENGFRMN